MELAFRIVVAALVGLALGSFATVLVARVPAGESLVAPGSKCPVCSTPILKRDNVPVVSWALLRGKCRACGARIPIRYPLLELSTAAVVVGAVVVWEDLWIAAAVALLLALMPALALIDIDHRIIPNRIIYPALVAFPVYLVVARLFGAPVDLLDLAFGFLLYGGGLFVVALVSRGMGMGDVKLAALIGLVLGAVDLGLVGVAAGAAIVTGGVVAVAMLLRGSGRKNTLPFGPSLAFGAVVAGLWGPRIADWYARTFLHA